MRSSFSVSENTQECEKLGSALKQEGEEEVDAVFTGPIGQEELEIFNRVSDEIVYSSTVSAVTGLAQRHENYEVLAGVLFRQHARQHVGSAHVFPIPQRSHQTPKCEPDQEAVDERGLEAGDGSRKGAGEAEMNYERKGDTSTTRY
ncbi:uncharacterized protein V6R79_002973 [Siganus canaliculatus]